MKLAVAKWRRKYVTAVRRPLKLGVLAALAVVVLHDFIFAGSPELFDNAGKFWELLYKLALAFLASFVFFYVNVHLPRQQDRENLHQFLNQKTFHIVGDAQHVIRGLRMTSGHDTKPDSKDDFPSLPDLKTMCSKVHPYGEAPLYFADVGRNANWMEYLVHFRNSTKETAGSIYTKISFLDSEYLKLVMDVDDCPYFSQLQDVASIPLKNNDLAAWADALYEYLQKVKRLRDYAHHEFRVTP